MVSAAHTGRAGSLRHRHRVALVPRARPSSSIVTGTMTFWFGGPGMTFGFVQLPQMISVKVVPAENVLFGDSGMSVCSSHLYKYRWDKHRQKVVPD